MKICIQSFQRDFNVYVTEIDYEGLDTVEKINIILEEINNIKAELTGLLLKANQK